MSVFWVQPLLLLSIATASVAAEPLPFWRSSLSHQAWTKQDGAPSNPSAIVQDQTGMLWLGASNGLFRFDGVRFERVDELGGHALLSPNVFALALFGDALWLGYAHGGISVFEHGAVRHYGEAEGVPASAIMQFGRTADGRQWFSSAAGIHWLDGTRWRRVGPADGLPSTDQATLNVLPEGGLLVTHVSGLYRNLPGTHRFRRVDDFGSMQRSQLTADGKLLVFRFGYPVRLFDPVTESSTPLRLPDMGVPPYSVHRDRRNAWWIGPGDGMRLYNPELQLHKQFKAPHDFSAVRIFRPPFDDREGNLWFLTENGVDRIRETRLTVQDMPAGSTDFSITAGPDGEVWISSHSSLDPYSPPTFAIAADGRRIASDMPSATAGTLAADGTLWFANVHWVWSRRDGKTQRWPLPPELIEQPVQAIAMDGDGRLWLSIMRRGVYTFKDGAWQAGGGHAALAGRSAVSLHADGQGRLWFGYTGNSMAMLQQGKLQQFSAADGLKIGNALAMVSRRGTLWVGGDQGLARFHNGRFVALNDSDGQPFAGVAGIVETAQGELWLHGQDGLLRIGAADLAATLRGNSERVSAERYSYLDGYAGAAHQVIPLNTLIEAGDGRLWYATSSSVGLADPRRATPRNPVAPTPVITWLHTDRQHYRAASGIDLPQHTHNLHIDFTAAVLSVPQRARFRTRLVGQDHEWRDAGALRQAFYTNLGPGDYRFEVMAANEDGLWSVAPASLSFRIAPAFYQTSWFGLACAALLVGVLYRMYLWRIGQMTARVIDRMRARVDERERIARTLHDTFLQSVHSLSLRFQGIKAVLPKNDAIHQQIDDALDAADAVAEEGREQLMDLRVNYACRGELAPVLQSLGSAAAAQHGVAFTLHEQGTRRLLQAEAQEELFAIAREAVGNALRHAGGSEVQVRLSYGASSLTLEVRDNGKGVPDAVRSAGHRERHWGLAGMRERAARIGAKLAILSTPGAGTRVVLTLRATLAYR
ncbi:MULTISPECIES: triple tyrosine motif-containing protein [unclassified Duganella]|uniref:sensor histidine kinase n=1 Tax=unclassified Duganella TaxID=2636909 RepID=UPI00088A90E7|nr:MULTISPECIES: triple tyrosine motif-containing protein [unclassified Duganella]SDG19348.1 Signal transduction histidine kinase [Duganella sp. OV458]SDJ28831.1 Signal transduction histidine kinase [Duganella sp. OV510]